MVSKDVDPMRNILIQLYRRMLKLKLKKGGNTSSSWLHRNRSDSAASVFGYNRFMEVNISNFHQGDTVLMKCWMLLLGFGCSNTSVCFKIFSVQCLVHSALVRRFSKCASNSVFSAWPSFSSVNCLSGKRHFVWIRTPNILQEVTHFNIHYTF